MRYVLQWVPIPRSQLGNYARNKLSPVHAVCHIRATVHVCSSHLISIILHSLHATLHNNVVSVYMFSQRIAFIVLNRCQETTTDMGGQRLLPATGCTMARGFILTTTSEQINYRRPPNSSSSRRAAFLWFRIRNRTVY